MRTYYDHERGYLAIRERGGTGWDDCPTLASPSTDSYAPIDAFLESRFAPPGDVIDLGCGGGQTSLRLVARGHRVTAIDFSPTAIELARANAEKAGVMVTFLAGDCLELDFAEASFDLAIDNHLLHCLIGPDRGRLLRGVARVLRPGGLLFSDTMSREGSFDPAMMHCDPSTFISLHNNRYWTSERELDDELAAAGFEIIDRGARPEEPGIGIGLIRVARLL